MFKLAINNLKRHKKSTLFTFIGLVLIATSIFSLIFLLLSYRQYRENAEREEQNWEARYSNLQKSEIDKIKNNENVKEVSIIKDNGTMEYVMEANVATTEKLKLVSYDENAMKNMNLKIKEGRLPQNENEIVISLSGGTQIYFAQKEYTIGDTILFENEHASKEYTIVGTAYSTIYDESYMYNYTTGAITYLNNIEENAVYDVYVLYKNPSKIYETNEQIITQIGEDKEISYNEELLNYMLVGEKNSSFEKQLYIVGGIILTIIILISFIFIYTIYSIFLSNRKKEFGTLRSIGASKKQIRKLIYSETFILNIVTIPISILISSGIVSIILNVWNHSIEKLTGSALAQFIVNNVTQFHFVISIPFIIIGVIFILVITAISVWIPVRNISKISPLEVIRQNHNLKIKKEQKYRHKWVFKVFGEEGYIAYQYISKNKGKTISIGLAIMLSVMVFIIVSNYLMNVYAQTPNDNREYNYLTYADNLESYQDLITDLKERNFVENNYTKEILGETLSLKLEDGDIHAELMNFMNSNVVPYAFYNMYDEQLPKLDCNIFTIVEDNEYENLLKELGLSNLKDDECILLNHINLPQVGDFHLTNFKDGDEIHLFNAQYSQEERENAPDLFGNEDNHFEYQYEALQDITLKAIKVVDSLGKFANYSDFNSLYNKPVQILVNRNTLNTIKRELEKQYKEYDIQTALTVDTQYEMYIESSNPYELEEYLTQNNNGISVGVNYQEEIDSTNNNRLIVGLVLYSFIIFIAIACILNIFCIIYFSIQSRIQEFAILKSLGMSKKQMNKMLNIECLMYSVISLIIGLILGVSIHKIIYDVQYNLSNHFMYEFSVSLTSIGVCVLFVMLVVFISMKIAKRKIPYENLTEIIKREGI